MPYSLAEGEGFWSHPGKYQKMKKNRERSEKGKFSDFDYQGVIFFNENRFPVRFNKDNSQIPQLVLLA